ncbi:MAG TPA: hypothetical protein VF297_01700 [Pyrinomonadaceae bacterium]
MLPILCAGFLLASSGSAQKRRAPHEGPVTPPIELSEITLEYAVPNESGSAIVWKTPTAEAPNTIPATARKLRFTAKVVNRQKGSTIRIKAALQEVCPSPDGDKKFLAKLRHLTESDATNATTDPADNETQVIDQDGRVTIEIPTHCDDCERSTCGDSCDRDHLGEGPHITTLTTSDPPPSLRARQGKKHGAAARPASFRLDVVTVCPEEELRKRTR